jgi:Na+/H+ antiporter NhaD/arsenite permease-like protein
MTSPALTAATAPPALPPGAATGVLVVFAIVYLGMFLGGLPRLKLDRSGVALLGGIAVIAITGLSLEEAARAVDLPTLVLLFAFMVVSAQLRMAGFYGAVARRLGSLEGSDAMLLAGLLATAAALSAVFSNDVICLAMTPWVARLCLQRRLAPVPVLVGLACAANIGSAATLIGNPQNMLIGSVRQLDFGAYLMAALPAVLVSLVLTWGWVVWCLRGRTRALAAQAAAVRTPVPTPPEPPFDRVQTAKGLLVAGVLMVVFLAGTGSREVAALVGAGVLLLSRRLHSGEVMGMVDWPLLLLFIGLFIVNHAMQSTGLSTQAVQALAAQGLHLSEPGVLLVLGVLLSNLVSNVPAVMLLLPHLPAGSPDAAVLLALASTFAGNLLLVGSIANLIVADLAAREGVTIGWREHARVGVPVTLVSLLALWVCLPAARG